MTKKTTTKQPWPTKKAMEQIYELNLWGNNQSRFYSGDGSHHPDLVVPYIDAVKYFLQSFKTPLVVCDLGCGDFNVGKELTAYTKQYIAVDIVNDLIVHNKEKYKTDNLKFQCIDIATDALPMADCAIVRQVLQHLSNVEIHRIIKKLSAYKYVIVTEHLPHGNFEPNADIIAGQGIRLKKQSGVNLLASPFYFKVKEAKELLSVPLKAGNGVITTNLYRVF